MEDFSRNRSLVTSSDRVQLDQYDVVFALNFVSTLILWITIDCDVKKQVTFYSSTLLRRLCRDIFLRCFPMFTITTQQISLRSFIVFIFLAIVFGYFTEEIKCNSIFLTNEFC